jgi:uncharacterized protein (DUF927 family)
MADTAQMFDPLSVEELATAPGAEPSKPNKTPIVPVPENAPPMRFRHPEHGEPGKTYAYEDADGGLVGYVCRWDFQNAEGEPAKEIRPVCLCALGSGQSSWCAVGFPTPRPLYRLPDILAMPDATVLVVEGEKAAEAGTTLFPDMVVTTPPHGADSSHKADWTPLEGRTVVVWPDHDERGTEYAQAVGNLCTNAGAASVAIVDVPEGFRAKWDLAEELPEGWTVEGLRKLLAGAHPFDPESAKPQAKALRFWPFRLGPEGVEHLVEREDKDTHEVQQEWEWFSSPLEIVADTRDSEGQNWGRLLVVTDRDGTPHEWALPMEMLAGSGEEYRRRLLSLGLVIAPGRTARHLLHEYLSTAQPEAKARCVARIGWHGSAFVLPDETLGDTGGERVLLQTVAAFDHAFRVQGTLEDWQGNVAQLTAGNSRLVFALSAAFAASLVGVADAESGGFHLRGSSSIGKTTALVIAGSAWGGGGVKGYVRQWRATDNGLEAVAQAHCDALLCLDELSQIDGRAAGAAAYMLANEAGKSRAKRTGEGRSPAEWRVLFLSSGEMSLADKAAEDGRKLAAGQRVRVIDLPADAGAGLGLFENLHGFDNADAFAQRLKENASKFYGVAAIEFLAKVAAGRDDAREAVKRFKEEFVSENCPTGADGQVSRAAERFGLVAGAGELATTLHIVPWEPGEATKAAAVCFRAWLDQRGGIEPAEVTDAIAQVRQFIEMHGESRFTPWSTCSEANDRPTINRAGFRKTGDDGVEYFVLPEVWRSEVCKGHDAGAVARALAERDMLRTDKDGKPQYSVRLPGFPKTVRCYVLTSALFEGGEHA